MVVCGLFQSSLKELSVLAHPCRHDDVMTALMHSSYTAANVRFPCW